MTRALDIEGLYRTHGHVVVRRARHLLGSDDAALDVLQEVFVSLHEQPTPFRGDSSVTTWLYRVTTNFCLNRLRNVKTRHRLLDEQVAPIASEEGAPRQEDLAAVRKLLGDMPEALAQAAVYYYVDELTLEEVAETMRCSRRHAWNLVQRARAWAQDKEVA